MRPVPLVLGSLAALLSLGVAVLLYRGFGGGDVGFGVRSYAVTSDEQVRVVFEVDKDPARTALCTVRARDRYGSETGSALVRVGPSAGRHSVVTYDLATRARANTGEVTGCSLEAAAPKPPG